MVLGEMADSRAEAGKVQGEPRLSMPEIKGVIQKSMGVSQKYPGVSLGACQIWESLSHQEE